MLIFSNPILTVGIFLVCALHIAACFVSGKIPTILNIVNICLHIALFFLLIFFDIPFDESVLIYMFSALVYGVSHYVAARLAADKGGEMSDL